MARRREVISLEKMSDSKIQLLRFILEDGEVEILHSASIDLPQKEHSFKDILKKNVGRISVPFPLESSYIYETQIPRNASGKTLSYVLHMTQEVNTPREEKSLKTFYLKGEDKEDKTQYFQISVSDSLIPFSEEIELGLAATNPFAFFQSFSRIFHFPTNETSLLLYQKKQGLIVAWGKNGKVSCIRNLSKYHSDQWPILAEQIFSAVPGIKYFYSWCDARFQALLNQSKHLITWTHLQEKGLPKNLKGNEENLEGICAALAFALEYSNPVIELSGNHLSSLNLSSLRQTWIKSLKLVSLTGILLLSLGWTQVYKAKKEISAISQKFEEVFYSFFSAKTPMLAPLQQLQEKIDQQKKLQSSTSGITHHQLLKTLNHLYESKPAHVSVNLIDSLDHQFKIEVMGASSEEIRQWSEKIQDGEFKDIRLSEERNTGSNNSLTYYLTFTLVSSS